MCEGGRGRGRGKREREREQVNCSCIAGWCCLSGKRKKFAIKLKTEKKKLKLCHFMPLPRSWGEWGLCVWCVCVVSWAHTPGLGYRFKQFIVGTFWQSTLIFSLSLAVSLYLQLSLSLALAPSFPPLFPSLPSYSAVNFNCLHRESSKNWNNLSNICWHFMAWTLDVVYLQLPLPITLCFPSSLLCFAFALLPRLPPPLSDCPAAH